MSAYCAELFSISSPMIEIVRHPVTGRVDVQPHEHADLFQLTFLRSCGGRVLGGDAWVGVSGHSALAAYPGERHGYELRAMADNAEVTLVKLPVPDQSVLCASHPFPRVATTLHALPELEAAIDRLHRDVTPTHRAIPRWVADAAVVLSTWPRVTEQSADTVHTEHTDEASDPAVQAALSLIENRIGSPPTLDELARSAHLSSRQLSRRFQRLIGRTPHEYITERRIARARALLFDTRLKGSDVAGALGFSSHAAFTRWFRQHEGRAPAEFRADPTRY